MARQEYIDGIQRGDDATPDWNKEILDKAIEKLARKGENFDGSKVAVMANTMYPELVGQLNFYGVGAALRRATNNGLIRKVGKTEPTSRLSHNDVVTEWTVVR